MACLHHRRCHLGSPGVVVMASQPIGLESNRLGPKNVSFLGIFYVHKFESLRFLQFKTEFSVIKKLFSRNEWCFQKI